MIYYKYTIYDEYYFIKHSMVFICFHLVKLQVANCHQLGKVSWLKHCWIYKNKNAFISEGYWSVVWSANWFSEYSMFFLAVAGCCVCPMLQDIRNAQVYGFCVLQFEVSGIPPSIVLGYFLGSVATNPYQYLHWFSELYFHLLYQSLFLFWGIFCLLLTYVYYTSNLSFLNVLHLHYLGTYAAALFIQ